MDPDLKDWRLDLEASTVTRVKGYRADEEVRVPGLTIVHHPDAWRVGETAPLAALSSGQSAPLSRLEPFFAPISGGAPRPLADAHVSRRPLRLSMTPADTVRIEGAGSGAQLEVDGRSISDACEVPTSDFDEGVTLRLADRLVLLLHWLDPTPSPVGDDLGLVGESSVMEALRRDIRRVARLDAPVLLRGETGTGKELVAAAVHRLSGRSDAAFVAVNVAAISPSLAASELFGAVKGAYTGAVSGHEGFFRRAEGGTLLLDEIGEAPVELQILLLRALESGQIQPVGADRTVPVDVRVLAATDAPLEELVAAGDFRAPLIHRLAGLVLRLPPLRQRRDDIARLLIHFLRQELDSLGALDCLSPAPRGQRPWLSAAAVERLVRHGWPGNVRQLRNVARQIAASGFQAEEIDQRGVDRLLEDQDPRPESSSSGAAPKENRQPGENWHGRPSQISEELLRGVLHSHDYRLAPVASHLGISRTSLYGLLDRFGIRRASQVPGTELEQGVERHDGDLGALAAELEVSAAGLRQRWRQWRDLARRDPESSGQVGG